MPSIGFGPLHGSAVTDRPPARAGTFNAQTWFKDASAAGKTDGTVADASWLNCIIGNLVYLCNQGNVDPNNDQSGDSYVFDAVAALIAQAVAGISGLTAVATDATLEGNGTVGNPLGLSAALLSQIASIGQLQARIAQEELRAAGVEGALLRRLLVLERGEAPRASTTAYGFARLGIGPSSATESNPLGHWTLI